MMSLLSSFFFPLYNPVHFCLCFLHVHRILFRFYVYHIVRSGRIKIFPGNSGLHSKISQRSALSLKPEKKKKKNTHRMRGMKQQNQQKLFVTLFNFFHVLLLFFMFFFDMCSYYYFIFFSLHVCVFFYCFVNGLKQNAESRNQTRTMHK